MRKRLNAAQRRKIHEKTHGHCAYCGCELPLKDMQVDHVVPLSGGGADEEPNMLPACRSCNHFKDGMTLERFRAAIERWPDVLMRDSVTYKNAARFGLVEPKPHRVVFYFETIAAGVRGGVLSGEQEKRRALKMGMLKGNMEINDFDDCLEVIKTLTTVIDGLYDLVGGPLTTDPFNSSTTIDDALKRLGIPEGFFCNTAEKMELFRSILVGDCLNWQKLIQEECDDRAISEAGGLEGGVK
jgi:hypothetical protein